MSRGNQREKARAKNLQKQKAEKHKNTMSGTEYQRAKEDAAAIMREKQRLADERRAAEAAKKK
ncbi:four F5 protein [Aspergillus ambiguus]|uniref:4F5 domain protein n=1 Tax=Aspergillus ambiguus TaxID=176160 RepID=UPI003CCD7C60